jgi:cytochrome P450
MKYALNVIIGAGYGMPFSWDTATQDIWPNHKLSFRDAVDTVMHHLFAILLVPEMLLKLPIKHFRDAELGYKEFGSYMRELLERERQLGKASDGQNLLSALVKHSAMEKGEQGVLRDQEIIGNTFIFLIAGHETTYHSQHIFLT